MQKRIIPLKCRFSALKTVFCRKEKEKKEKKELD